MALAVSQRLGSVILGRTDNTEVEMAVKRDVQ